MTVEVTTPSGTVAFTFKNTGLTTSIITDIFFEYAGLFVGKSSLSDSDNAGTAVDFKNAKNPGNLPGGNTISFNEALNQSPAMKGDVAAGVNNVNNAGNQVY